MRAARWLAVAAGAMAARAVVRRLGASYDFAGKVVVITGGSRGLGLVLARRFAAEGARLALLARDAGELARAQQELTDDGATALVLRCDVRSQPQINDAISQVSRLLGGIDVLVNNAGGGVGGMIWRVGDDDAAREAFEVNYWSPLALIAAVVPEMRERGTGTIVNVTSVAQVSTWPGFGGYAATKAALGLATETLAMELAPLGIHVVEAIPGPVDTAVQGETRLAPGIDRMIDRVPLGDAREMAERIARAIERDAARVIYPRRAAVGYVLPGLARREARRQAARTARELDPALREALAELIVRTGSQGDEVARQAREAWERERGR